MTTLITLLAALTFADVTSERYPDADAVLVDECTRVTYRPDGTYEEAGESWTKILTEKGRREERSLSLHYSKRFGRARIDYVGIVGTNGVERKVDVSATTSESTDNSSMGMNIYDPLDRRIVSTVPGLAVGEVLHVRTVRTAEKPRCENVWADLSVMEWSLPIVRSRWEIRAPKERPLGKVAVRAPLGNVTSSSQTLADGSALHVFVCTNSPQAFPEPDMPPLYTQVQRVLVSTASSWPEISTWYWNLCAPHLAKTNAAMCAKVEELRRGAVGQSGSASTSHLMRSIFKFVSQEVRYMGLTMEDTSPGYAPHDVDVTFDNRYGVCRDKAGLLVALLRLAGFRAYPVLINVGAKQDPEVPQPFFNHAIVAVDEAAPGEEPRYLLMDPTNENAKDLFPAYESDMSYLVARPEGDRLRTTPVLPPDHNALRVRTVGKVAKDGALFLENEIAFDGVNDTIYRHALVKMKGEDRVKFFERVVRRMVPGSELVRCEIVPADMRDTDSPIRVRLASRMPEMILRGRTCDRFEVPFVTKALGMANFLLSGNTSLETRRFPLCLDSTGCVDETVEIDVSAALGAPQDLPPSVRLSDGYDFSRDYSVSNGTLRARRRLAISKVEYAPADYLQLREDIKRVEAAERRTPVFAAEGLADANVQWLEDATEVDIVSDTAWTVSNRVVKKVLTYEGKKRSAELKFSYNPAVERLDLLFATVRNPDGRTASATPKEINEMDCGWAASAPRYPASKILVVNLPSVEIGSVISYAVARTVTNAPAGYYGRFAFDSVDPLRRRYVRVNGWSREVLDPRRIPNEPGQPAADLWRDLVVVASNRFACADLRIEPLVSPAVPADGGVRGIRDWMAKNVKVTGPALYELPLGRQLTDPRVVLRERYASRLDYLRTMAALLRGAGYEADVVFAADDADDPPVLRERDRAERPDVRAFAFALCRVRESSGGFLGFGGETRTLFLGTESQYAPLGPTAFDGCTYFDPQTGDFGLVGVSDSSFASRTEETAEYRVRENGAVDLTCVRTQYGDSVGAFRKTYEEILPEDRSRLYQSILGDIAQAASATGDLETDTHGYPATRKFSCFIPDYATVDGETLTLRLPPLLTSLPTFTGTARQTPFAVPAAEAETERVRVLFPAGYTEIEHLPESFRFSDPADPSRPWLTCRVTTAVTNGVREVEIVRTVSPRADASFLPDFIEFVKDRNRIASSRANRTIVVRRKDKGQ